MTAAQPAVMRELLTEGCQACIEQGVGVGRVVNAVTLVFDSNVDVVPQGIRLRFGVRPGNDRTLGIEQAGGRQRCFEFGDLAIDLGLYSVDVECGGISMAGRAGRYIRCEGVVFTGAHVAGNAGVLDRRGVHAGGACNGTGTTDAKQHVALRAVVWAKAIGDIDLAFDSCGNKPTCLVAVGAQVAHATVEGCAAGEHCHRGGGLQGEVLDGVGGVDLVASAAVLAGGVWITSLKLVGGQSRSDHGAETATGVTTGATFVGSLFYKGYTGSVQGQAPSGHFTGEQRGVVVAFGAGQIGC